MGYRFCEKMTPLQALIMLFGICTILIHLDIYQKSNRVNLHGMLFLFPLGILLFAIKSFMYLSPLSLLFEVFRCE